MALQRDVGESLPAFIRALERASQLYDADERGKDRAGSLEAMIAVSEFLKQIGVDQSLLRPLKAIILAFGDAQRGRANRLFEIMSVTHRSPLPIEDQLSRASAAVAMELLMRSGFKRRAAAEEVATAVRKWNLPALDTHLVTWKTVKNWRDKINGGSSDDAEVMSFRAVIAKIEGLDADLIVIARSMLASPYRLQPKTKST